MSLKCILQGQNDKSLKLDNSVLKQDDEDVTNQVKELVKPTIEEIGAASATHAAQHATNGSDPLTPEAIGAVGYNTTQSLTSAQQVQVRNNINAAPGGYGYGEMIQRIGSGDMPDDEFVSLLEDQLSKLGYNEAIQLCWTNHPTVTGATFVGTLWKTYLGNYAVLTGVNYFGDNVVRRKVNGVWQPTEWFNPPMQLGVEYRTAERYLGKPVYCQVIDCGVITTDTQKIVDKSIPVLDVLSCEGIIHTNSNGHNQATPFDYSDTNGTKYSVTVSAEAYKQSEVDRLSIYVNSSWTVTGSVHAIVRYTKETDQ